MTGPEPAARSILVVDDDPEMGLLVKMIFDQEGYRTELLQTGRDGLKSFTADPPAVALLDLKLPDMSGIELLEKMRTIDPEVPILILTGYGEVSTAVSAIKKGAYHYLCKPYQKAELILLVARAISESRRESRIEALGRRLSLGRESGFVPGSSPAMKETLLRAEKVAPTDMTVILQGESGVGKEILARVLHRSSPRRDKPFIALDCGTLPENLVETELFGHERGAFTGADRKKLGQIEIAEGGTLFLDEIGNLPPPVQAKLLRVIQERSVRHLGGRLDIPVDVRIVVATNLDLRAEVAAGRFREDLFHRLDEFTLTIPPLRERRSDIPALAESFLRQARRTLRKDTRAISPEAMDLLVKARWPGNIRQLKNVIRAAALMADDLIEPVHLLQLLVHDRQAAAEIPVLDRGLKEAALSAERAVIIQTLKKTGNNKAQTARLLKIDRTVLYEKMKRFGISL